MGTYNGPVVAAHRKFLSVSYRDVTTDLLSVLSVPPLGIFDFYAWNIWKLGISSPYSVHLIDFINYKAIVINNLGGIFGGERGIRTPGPDEGSTVFKTAAFDRSASSPDK